MESYTSLQMSLAMVDRLIGQVVAIEAGGNFLSSSSDASGGGLCMTSCGSRDHPIHFVVKWHPSIEGAVYLSSAATTFLSAKPGAEFSGPVSNRLRGEIQYYRNLGLAPEPLDWEAWHLVPQANGSHLLLSKAQGGYLAAPVFSQSVDGEVRPYLSGSPASALSQWRLHIEPAPRTPDPIQCGGPQAPSGAHQAYLAALPWVVLRSGSLAASGAGAGSQGDSTSGFRCDSPPSTGGGGGDPSSSAAAAPSALDGTQHLRDARPGDTAFELCRAPGGSGSTEGDAAGGFALMRVPLVRRASSCASDGGRHLVAEMVEGGWEDLSDLTSGALGIGALTTSARTACGLAAGFVDVPVPDACDADLYSGSWSAIDRAQPTAFAVAAPVVRHVEPRCAFKLVPIAGGAFALYSPPPHLSGSAAAPSGSGGSRGRWLSAHPDPSFSGHQQNELYTPRGIPFSRGVGAVELQREWEIFTLEPSPVRDGTVALRSCHTPPSWLSWGDAAAATPGGSSGGNGAVTLHPSMARTCGPTECWTVTGLAGALGALQLLALAEADAAGVRATGPIDRARTTQSTAAVAAGPWSATLASLLPLMGTREALTTVATVATKTRGVNSADETTAAAIRTPRQVRFAECSGSGGGRAGAPTGANAMSQSARPASADRGRAGVTRRAGGRTDGLRLRSGISEGDAMSRSAYPRLEHLSMLRGVSVQCTPIPSYVWRMMGGGNIAPTPAPLRAASTTVACAPCCPGPFRCASCGAARAPTSRAGGTAPFTSTEPRPIRVASILFPLTLQLSFSSRALQS